MSVDAMAGGFPGRRLSGMRQLFCGTCAFLGLILAGCSSIGPGTVPRDRIDYANALSDSWKDQMLLNIVRLRYGDTPTFLDVSSVIGAYSIGAQVQAGGAVNFGVPTGTTITPQATGSVSATGAFADRPTISYTPLTGKKFAQSLLQPIPPAAIFSLISAGYPVEMVLPVTVRALNGIYNHATLGGIRRPADPEFYPVVDAWRRIQASRSFSLRMKKEGDEQTTIGVFAAGITPEVQHDIDFIRDTLHIKTKNGELKLVYDSLQRTPDELAVLSRSMLEVMQEMSADIDVPPQDVSKGRTYATYHASSGDSPYDLPRVTIHSGPNAPGDAFTTVRYRGTSYWVSDDDFGSKRSLTFLLLFFSLAETGATPETPVLTIPVQ